MPYINTIDINGVVYTLENLTDGNNIVTLPELSKDDIFVLQGNIVNNTSSSSTTQPLSANQGRVLRNDLNAEIQNRINDVNLEESRATEAERVLTENLNKEIADREADVNAEETRATNAENTLTTNLNAEIARAQKSEADELARAQAAEKVLTDNLSAEVTRATNRENEINTSLTNEVSRATGAENTLTSNLDAEITRAKDAENTNATAISTEKSRAEGVENGLASRIATMEAFFKEADIDASKDFIDTLKEIQSYIASDKTGAAAMTASIQANATAIETEKSRADSAEGTLQSNINAEATTARAAEKANAYAIETEKSRAEGVEAEIKSEANKLKSLVDTKANVSTTDGLNDRLTEAEADIVVLENASHTHDNIEELDKIVDGSVDKWNSYDETISGLNTTIASLQSQIDELRALIQNELSGISTVTIYHSTDPNGEKSTYQYKEGMTWVVWVASEYNTDGYTVDDRGFVKSGDGNWLGYGGIDEGEIIVTNSLQAYETIDPNTYIYCYD